MFPLGALAYLRAFSLSGVNRKLTPSRPLAALAARRADSLAACSAQPEPKVDNPISITIKGPCETIDGRCMGCVLQWNGDMDRGKGRRLDKKTCLV